MPNPNELAPLTVIPGALRFNTDSMKLEYYRGGPVGFGTTTQTGEWVNLTTDSPDIQTGGARGLFGGGYNASPLSGNSNIIDYITISTSGNTLDFGDLSSGRRETGALSSAVRGVWGGGFAPLRTTIDFVTVSSTGNAFNFGNLTVARRFTRGLASSTRGVWGGGYAPGANNTIDYITISSTGDAVDFGDLSGVRYAPGHLSSPTRGLFVSGVGPGPTFFSFNLIDYITISTTGNTLDFGDTSGVVYIGGACSNSIRGVFSGYAIPGSTISNNIEYITIASFGNSIDFGDLTVTRSVYSCCSSSSRGIFFGGDTPTYSNVIDYVNIMSIGNAIDFGDISVQRTLGPAACSNGHGGLG